MEMTLVSHGRSDGEAPEERIQERIAGVRKRLSTLAADVVAFRTEMDSVIAEARELAVREGMEFTEGQTAAH